MPRVLIVRGHQATPWELRPWQELPERFEVAFLLTGSNRFDTPPGLQAERVRALRDLLPGGALGDVYGRRRVFAIGVALFALASAWCGLAPDVRQLIAARALQGIGGALLIPGSLALISVSYPAQARGRAIGTGRSAKRWFVNGANRPQRQWQGSMLRMAAAWPCYSKPGDRLRRPRPKDYSK